MAVRDRFLRAAMAMALATQVGCGALLFGGGAVAGAGVVAYVKGEMSVTEEVSLARAWTAAQAAMDDLEFIVVGREKDAASANLVARGAEDKRVEVKLARKAEELTEIRVRVGVFGDESLSMVILDRIRGRFSGPSPL